MRKGEKKSDLDDFDTAVIIHWKIYVRYSRYMQRAREWAGRLYDE